MAKATTPLNDKQIKAAQPSDKDYVLSDGNGLQMRIRSNGSKQWNFNYIHPITGKRLNMGLGTYPEISLATARKMTVESRALVAQGTDPKAQRDSERLFKKSQTEETLMKIAEEWFERKKDSITPAYADDIWSSFERHIFPKIANVPIHQITAPQVIALLRPLEARGNLETVKRLTQRLNEVMTHAVNSGVIHSNPLAGIKATFKRPKKENMAALKPEELPELVVTIANASIKRVTRCLIEWQLHTMTRPSEAAGTQWSEIDFDKKTWTIPAERMKKRRPHRIPLTPQALAVLEVMEPISRHREFVFPSDRNPKSHCNSQTANMALKRMGFAGRLVSHGLRSIASTILNEQGFDSEIIEAALAHADENQVRSAYNRADYFERRKPMMEWWSNHIEENAKGSLLSTGFKGLKIVSA
ncbi:MAG TPA: integrase domain-containing protein [Cellvibrio sp.]|nr:integrase domain-containing protein [Cellvibrio sp.]